MKNQLSPVAVSPVVYACLTLPLPSATTLAEPDPVTGICPEASITLASEGELRSYELSSTAELRDNSPPEKRIGIREVQELPRVRSGNLMFDGLYAMALSEARQNAVSQVSDWSYADGAPIELEAFQTGELWTYVWTRDLSYSVHLALAALAPARSLNSLLFKTSSEKESVRGGLRTQIVQDTGSGGSYPVSTDRTVWAMGAREVLKYLGPNEREYYLGRVYLILRDTLELDRRLIFDARDGLYRGEQSFLDWREQTYPAWTKENVLAIAASKSLTVNLCSYSALETAAEFAGLLALSAEQARYSGWAKELKVQINRHFFDEQAGLYSTFLLSERGTSTIRASRYDLLGQSLAVLSGVADPERAQRIVSQYPTGPHGPAVVWPTEKKVAIYHNRGIWPFVTAYWIKASRQAGNIEAVNRGIQSLQRLAALNLSNMENFDFVTGQPNVTAGDQRGPVINSRRQLWSVAGYLAMVQDIVFGLETSWEGIRFDPYITAVFRNTTLAGTNLIELCNFTFQGCRIDVRVHLPPPDSFGVGVCRIAAVRLNGKPIEPAFIPASSLRPYNTWEIELGVPLSTSAPAAARVVDCSSETIFAPAAPEWLEDGILAVKGQIVLKFTHEEPKSVSFNIYRDGVRCASSVRTLQWTDPAGRPGQYYTLEGVDLTSGYSSHLSKERTYRAAYNQIEIPASALESHDGVLSQKHHFVHWGGADQKLIARNVFVASAGHYEVRVQFSNGAGPVSTGITCAVKKLEVIESETGDLVGSGYVIMPQSGDWNRWDLSSAIRVHLNQGESYTVRLLEDETCRNMSYYESNSRYTAAAGGGEFSYNYVNVAGFRLDYSGG